MAMTIEINGVDKTANLYLPDSGGSLRFSRQSGGLGPATFKTFSASGTLYRPNIDESVVIKDGGTTVWSGVITDVDETGFTDIDAGVLTSVTAADHARLFNQLTYSASYTNVTLKAVLQDLIAGPFAPYGITLDAAQATGPTFTTLTFDEADGTAILNELQRLSGYPWRLSTSKVLRMVLPGSESSGLTLSDTSGFVLDKVTWRQTRSQEYTNSVRLYAGDSSRRDKDYTFPAVPPSTTQSNFTFPYPVADHYGYITVDGVFTPIGTGMAWTFNSGTNAFVASPAMPAGTVVSAKAAVQFPIVVTSIDSAEIAAHGTYKRRFDAPTIFDIVEAQAWADALKRLGIATPRIITVRHRGGGASIGQTVTLTFTGRNVSGTWLITTVEAEDDVDGALVYTFTCMEGTAEPQPAWQDFWRGAIGGGSSSGSGGTITGGVLPTTSGIFDESVVGDSTDSRVKIGFVGTIGGVEGAVGAGIEAAGDIPKWSLVSRDGGVGFREVRMLYWPTATTAETPFMLRQELLNYAVMPGHITNALTPCNLGSIADAAGSGRWDHVYGKILDAYTHTISAGGYYERARLTALGEWQDVTFAAGNFSADTGANWTLASGDQSTLAYSLTGLTLEYDFELITTTVVGTPLFLKIAIPGGRVVRHTKSGFIRRALDNGVLADAMVVAVAGETFIRIYADKTGTTNWTASTNLTEVRGSIRIPVTS